YNPIAVGDKVRIELINDDSGVIEELLPRKNAISRPTRIGTIKEKIIAANVDRLVAIVSAKEPRLKTGLIDRMLLVAERQDLKCTICINKTDLLGEGENLEEVECYKNLRYNIIQTSTVTGDGIEDLKKKLIGAFSVFIGQSGVGKSSILNSLQPGLDLKVQKVSGHNEKGKHTTSYVSAVFYDFGAVIADTPGFRNFGLWGLTKEDIAELYREFRKYSGTCRFNPCFHIHEPVCGVKDAFESGKIAKSRYENYVRIFDSFDEIDMQQY
ncbi:ribosome small subunit-dependent GTPase A, partial [candidate division KSB1 bacterium]